MERLLSFDKLQAWFGSALFFTDSGHWDHCWFLVRGPPPFFIRAFPTFSLAPRAPPLGDLAGPTHYPEGSPRDNFLQSVERSGVSTGLTWFWWFVRWFLVWGGSVSGGFGPRLVFLSGLPLETLP